jgi:hypothetical protein
MSFSALISDAISAIFSSIRDAVDVNTDDARAGAALSRSALGWLPAAAAAAVFTSLPQLMQVIFSPRRTWTPLHLGHGTLVSVPPFARREAPVLILLTLSSEEAMVECLLLTNFFFMLATLET